MHYTHVDKPIKLGRVELKNRIVRPAHGTNHGRGVMNDQLIAYHEARAKGGVAMSFIEVGSVHQTTPNHIDLWRPELEGGYRKLVATIRPHGMKLFQQLWHGGHNTLPVDGSPPWSASDLPGYEHRVVPIPMTRMMIDEIVDAFAVAAKRCEEWGLEGAEVHAAHGYLPAQFLSPALNKREDDYGGSLENRARFLIEVLEAVRASVSPNFAVGVRLSPDHIVGGLGPEENALVEQMLEDRGLIDFVNVSAGNYTTLHKTIGGMHEGVGYELPGSLPVLARARVPRIVIGRYRTLDDADQLIRSGEADLVGVVRGLIADPEMVSKSLAGQAERVRPCIGCNQGCVGMLFERAHMECSVNPVTGHELTMGESRLVAATEPKTVLVIGGGPAGMEAARVAAVRGHRVILAEASANLGGALQAAAKAPTRLAMMDIAIWQEQEIYRLGVDVRLSSYIEADEVMDLGAEAVIVATGSVPRMDGMQNSHLGQPITGMERRNVLSSHDLFLAPPANLGASAVVVDDVGSYEALSAAEHLAKQGLAVTLVTPMRGIGITAQFSLMVDPFLNRMADHDFDYMIRTRVIAIREGSVLVGPANLYDDRKSREIPADTVVVVTHNRPNREIFDALSDRNTDVRVVGDASTPRNLQMAIREGYLAGATV
jgi:2,4-dienoyl-CoA reductase-like NADH-dependent reductase (Old Yellow Enzyme family)/thioredoxin reductase